MTGLLRKGGFCGLLAAVVSAVAFTGGARAYYSGSASASGRASVATLNAPLSVRGTPGAGTAALSWRGVTPPAPGSVSYYVSRDGTPIGGSCGDPGSPIDGTSCTDSGLGVGSYDYTVTALWRSWTATSGPATRVTLDTGPASQLVLSGSTDNLGSGSTRQLTATVEDAAGNTVTSGPDSGISISFGQAGGTGSVSGTGSATASAGVATKTVTGATPGTVSMTAAGTLAGPGSTSSDTLDFSVVPLSGPADAARSTLTPTSSSITADGTATQLLTVQAKDANGNDQTTGGSTVTITRQSGTGTISPVTDNGDGTYTATATAPTTTGTGTFVATLDGNPVESGSTTQTEATVTYVPGPVDAARSTLTPTSSSITADGTATQLLTVQAKDANGNDQTTGGSTVTITRQSGTGTISPVTDNGDGTYTATATAPTTTGTGTFVATLDGNPVESGSTSQTQATVTYQAGPAAGIVLSDETTHPSPDVTCSGPVGSITCSSYDEGNGEPAAKTLTAKVTLVDEFQNPVTNTGGSITIDLEAAGWGSVDPCRAGALTIPTGASTTTASFTATRHNGNNKTLTVTATVHGTTQTLTIVLSSAAPPADGTTAPATTTTTTTATTTTTTTATADTGSTDETTTYATTTTAAASAPGDGTTHTAGLSTPHEVLFFTVVAVSLIGLVLVLTMPIPRRRTRRRPGA